MINEPTINARAERISGEQPKTRREWLFDASVSLIWAVLAALYLAKLLQAKGNGLDIGLTIYYLLAATFFLVRRAPVRSGNVGKTIFAAIAVFLPLLLLRPAPPHVFLSLIGLAIQGVALLGIIVSMISLGRSLSIAPADRGLVTHGMYRWVRHPLYATEISFYIGYLLTYLSFRNLTGLILALTMTIVRIHWEEQIIDHYEAYAQTVKWRLIPYIW